MLSHQKGVREDIKLQKALCWNLIHQISWEFFSSPSALILCLLIRKQLSPSFHAAVSRKTATDVTCPRRHLVPCRDLRFPHSDQAGGKYIPGSLI